MGIPPTSTQQTPWYQNPVVWTTYIGQFAAIFFAVSPLVVNYPGAPSWLVSAIGVIGAVLLQLGYQAHSATVRAAELEAAQSAVYYPMQAGEVAAP